MSKSDHNIQLFKYDKYNLPQTGLFPLAIVWNPKYNPQYRSERALLLVLQDVADEPETISKY